ncbi:MAG: hypothetical protein NTW68_00105 [candidate division NC10 bacterium]|nr:hypothetical protein [candidate division NC10 bacterium]
MGHTTTHELAALLARLEETLRTGPDLPVAELLAALGVPSLKKTRRASPPAEPPPPLDPITLTREEMAAALYDKKHFRTKKALAEFARAHGVAVSEKDKVAIIIGQILQVLYDIPRERTTLRALDLE